MKSRLLNFSFILTYLFWAAPAWSKQNVQLPKYNANFEPRVMRYQPIPKSNLTANISFKALVNGKTHLGTAAILGTLNVKRSSNQLVWSLTINSLDIVSPEFKSTEKKKFESYFPIKLNLWRNNRGKFTRAEIDNHPDSIKQFTPKELNNFAQLSIQQLDNTFQDIFPISSVGPGSILYSQAVSLPLNGTIFKVGSKTIVKGEMTHNGRLSLLSETKYQSNVPDFSIGGNGFTIIDVMTGMPAYSKGGYSASIKFNNETGSLDLSYDILIDLTKLSGTMAITNKNNEKSLKQRLSRIKKLLDAGLITENEAAAKRKSILNDL